MFNTSFYIHKWEKNSYNIIDMMIDSDTKSIFKKLVKIKRNIADLAKIIIDIMIKKLKLFSLIIKD